jgi:oxygen-independent coproporphyrinogen III oxidase
MAMATDFNTPSYTSLTAPVNVELLEASEGLLKQYGVRGPRYTSYPTVPAWNEDFTATTLVEQLVSNRDTFKETPRPLSLYVHLPFCEARCLFCSCNVVITRHQETARDYLDRLEQEINLVAAQVNTDRPVVQLHWGGGTPTYHNASQLERVFHMLQRHFKLDAKAEIALEVDPRVTSTGQLELLRSLGFNRLSMGVQDFDPKVQEAIHRVQSIGQTRDLLQASQELGFTGTNLDLIYGLPHQTEASFNKTLDTIIELNPDRLALYNFAFVPWLSPWQNALPEEAMPSGDVKFAIFKQAIARLLEAGYEYIGMDHFAKPTDELAVALKAGTLHRNFMGYTTRAGQADLLGFGLSAISALEGAYSQNVKQLPQYQQALSEGQLPTWRGLVLNAEDKRRRTIILALLCQGSLHFEALSDAFDLKFETTYAQELKTLRQQAEPDGLVTFTETGLSLLPLGRMFARNVAMVFDAYLPAQQQGTQPVFSKTL